jgi:hypothetical protein
MKERAFGYFSTILLKTVMTVFFIKTVVEFTAVSFTASSFNGIFEDDGGAFFCDIGLVQPVLDAVFAG